MTPAKIYPSEYERVKIFSLVKDDDGSISRVPMCLCGLCRVNHFLCPRYTNTSEKVLDELPRMSSTDLLLIAHDEWKRREERKHNHEESGWIAGWINGFLTSKKWAQKKVKELRQQEREQ